MIIDITCQNNNTKKPKKNNVIEEREEGSYDSNNYNSNYNYNSDGSDADNEDEDEDDSEDDSMEIFDDKITNTSNFDNNFTDCGYYDYKYGFD